MIWRQRTIATRGLDSGGGEDFVCQRPVRAKLRIPACHRPRLHGALKQFPHALPDAVLLRKGGHSGKAVVFAFSQCVHRPLRRDLSQRFQGFWRQWASPVIRVPPHRVGKPLFHHRMRDRGQRPRQRPFVLADGIQAILVCALQHTRDLPGR
ncbi:hypothetical protein D3C71_1390960 [compost metagenome]